MQKRTTGALIALIGLTMSIGMVGNAVAAPLTGQAYQSNAYGTHVNVAGLVQSGQTSAVGMGGCGTPAPPGFFRSATTLAVNIPNVLQTGVIDTAASTGPATGPFLASTSSSISDVSLLSGLVSASAVKAISTTTHDAAGYHVKATGSRLFGMVVAGMPMLGTPAPNTTIDLPGVGKVVLNQQKTRMTANGASMTVNMIDITLSMAKDGLPAGTQIVVGHADSALTQTSIANAATLRGSAFSASAHVGSLITLGQEFAVSMCGNTNGRPATNSAVSTNIPGILSSGTAANSVNGTLGTPTSTSVSTATIQSLNLLSGLVSVDAIKSEANATLTGSTVGLDETGSAFTNLVVNGQGMPADVAPNTKITLGGLVIWLNRVNRDANSITVTMIEVTVKGANPQGLPIGTDIKVASASAGGYPNPTS